VTDKSLGIAACTAIVVGNMVGSGFYLSPAAVAPLGNLAILAWIVMGAGALGLTFAKLARLVPATGGPYAYTRMAYGDFPGFLIAWGYWISIWTSLPVIAIAFAGAIFDLVPGLHNRTMAVALTLGAIWAVVLVNLRGVKVAGDTSHFSELNPSGKSLIGASAALAPLTMFAFLGLESATVPAGDVINPRRTIPRSTVLGICIAALLYVLGTIAVFGLVPPEQLVHSVAPFSDAARTLGGSWGAKVISLAVILSAIGALNGWTLLMGQVPMAAARDGLFPPVFGKLSDRGVPAIGIAVSAVLATLLILSQVAGPPGFSSFYTLVVGLSTMAAVVPYAFCSLSPGLVAANVIGGGPVPRLTIVEVIAYGCGAEPVLYGFTMLVLGIPVYVWQRRRAGQAELSNIGLSSDKS